jgi:hydrogenase maturation factor HypE
MSTEVHNPVVVPTEAAAPVAPIVPAESIPVVSPAHGEVKPIEFEPVEPKVDEAAAPAEKKEEEIVEPIYSGALGYKAPGLKK